MKNLMKQFAQCSRTVNYFKTEAQDQINIAYRIMEYLSPDSTYPAGDLNKETLKMMIAKNFKQAFENVTVEINQYIGIGETYKYEDEAIELMEELLPVYLAEVASDKEKRKAELYAEIAKLDE
jgi:hypothetical protein